MRHFAVLVVITAMALTWVATAQSEHVTLPARAVAACTEAIDRQIAAGIQAGGGPKSVDVAPLNCDTFWFRDEVIGNELAGGPVACFWSLQRVPPLPEHCPPGS